MSEEYGNIYSTECLGYRDTASRCRLKIEQTRENQSRFTALEAQIDNYTALADSMTLLIGTIKPWMTDLLEYNAQKKKDSLLSINSALSVANFVVPSSMKGIKFKIEGKEAWLENEEGMDADRLEGSGYKGTVSVYLRNVVLRANPALLQFMILDEPLAKLSPESSAIFSTYIPLLAENMQIIWVEHKKEVFSNVENKVVYTFFKDDKEHTLALKEE